MRSLALALAIMPSPKMLAGWSRSLAALLSQSRPVGFQVTAYSALTALIAEAKLGPLTLTAWLLLVLLRNVFLLRRSATGK